MLHTLHAKFQRVRDLITKYDEDDDRCGKCGNPNPAFRDFVQELKAIMNVKSEVTRKDGTNFSNLGSNRNDNVSGSSSSSSQIAFGDPINNPHPKVVEALKNHVVLTEIFKCGSFRDLKNFRLLNKQWKGIANSAIIQRRLWKLSINGKFKAFFSDKNKALSALNDCIETSHGSFPLTSLDFSNIDDYNSWNGAAVLRFYALIGQSIKRVKFSNFGPLTVNEFQDLLVNKMPNVDHICAGNIFFTNQEEYHVPVALPHLKTIRFIDLSNHNGLMFKVLPYYKYLLLAATNLKEILDSQVQHTGIVFDAGKMNCIHSVNFDWDLKAYSALYNKLSFFQPKLTSLAVTRYCFQIGNNGENFVLYSPELAQSLRRILVSSKDTLKHLECMPHIFPGDFLLPKFPSLECLNVFDITDESDDAPLPRVFPAVGCACSEIFPNLHTVVLDIRLNKNATLYKYFQSQVFPSVKNFEFQDSIQLGSAFKTIFPNVSNIKIINYERMTSVTEDDIKVFNKAFHSEIAKLHKQIESLEFHHCLLAHSRREFQLDALITGVPTNICKNLLLRHNGDTVRGCGDDQIVDVKEFLELVQAQNYLFRNSEGLRRLKIVFNHKDNVNFRICKNLGSDLGSDCEDVNDNGDAESWNAVISPVSCVYGFSLMPNLEEVIIGYDHHLPNASDIAQVFEPFAQFPYVKIVHEPTVKD